MLVLYDRTQLYNRQRISIHRMLYIYAVHLIFSRTMANFCEKLDFFPANELETNPRGKGQSAPRGCRRGDVVARDDVIECKSLRYTVIEHFSHFPSHPSCRALSLIRVTVLFALNENSSKYCRRCSFVDALANRARSTHSHNTNIFF